jgi:hypothetical protein
MQQLFYVAHMGEQKGPYSLDEIIKLIQSSELDLQDYLYDEAAQDWVVLMAYPALGERIKAMKPSAPPKTAQKEETPVAGAVAGPDGNIDVKTIEWYMLKGERKFGPFTYVELVKMLQDKSLYEFDYVWHAGLQTWHRIAELNEFTPESIRKLKSLTVSNLTEVFFRRRHARVAYGGSLLVHDNAKVWKGTSVEIGAGGASIIVDNADFETGQKIYLHFKPADGLPPFNATCEIVLKKPVVGSERGPSAHYGLKFIEINQNMQKSIRDFAEKKKRTKAA